VFLILKKYVGKDGGRGVKRPKKDAHADGSKSKKHRPEKEGKKDGNSACEPEFSYLRFKFLLRSPDTVGKGIVEQHYEYFVVI
jgi:hypothetical protein